MTWDLNIKIGHKALHVNSFDLVICNFNTDTHICVSYSLRADLNTGNDKVITGDMTLFVVDILGWNVKILFPLTFLFFTLL